jgi:hypothetical protein|tara:strand:- start:550 stop:750 length:201 start_codon:yes stop_codon:yes gene_type:complete
MNFKKLTVKKEDKCTIHRVSGSCLDCDWQDDITKAETDWCGDYDEFRGENITTKICPKCGGGVEID